MITELVTSLFGGGIGVIARMLPEVVKYFQDKADRAHELEMTRLQGVQSMTRRCAKCSSPREGR